MNPGIGPFFQLTVCANSVGVCVHQMNKYLPHAYIYNALKATKSFYTQEHNEGKQTKE